MWIGWMRRPVMLGGKLDECPGCHQAGPHLLLRLTTWFTVWGVPLVLLWVQHCVVCAECGHRTDVGMLDALRAMRSHKLPLGRPRPGYDAFAQAKGGGPDSAEWAAFGLKPGASEAEVTARWHELAKRHHPDMGGDTAAFVRLHEIRDRLLSIPKSGHEAMPSAAELFDPLIINPRRGAFDLYTKVWPILATMILVAVIAGGGLAPPSPSPASSSTYGPVAGPQSVGAAHTCWASGTTLNGCLDTDSTSMMFGTQTGTETTCYFDVAPVDGGSVQCSQ